MTEIKKILVANRGEIAVRIIRTCRTLGIATVAVYSDADRSALHVALADEAVAIGPARASESYLQIGALVETALHTGCDAIHPGYGFLAESEAFARAVTHAGLIFVGPDAETMTLMGNKVRARKAAQDAGLPVLSGSRYFAAEDSGGLAEAAEQIGYPVLVKAAMGGGGIGMSVAETPDMLLSRAALTQRSALRAFGDGTIFLERFIRNARHVEVQVFGFGDGRAVHLHERECSIQRRFQKVIEESPSPGISQDVRARITAAAIALAQACRYAGAGTIEFIVNDDTGEFFFLEMNTRIQVEHPVTEAVTGIDIVGLQLRLSSGEDLAADLMSSQPSSSGHAIEARLCAENPARSFMPSPGRLAVLKLPDDMPGCRVDTGVREGDEISPHYDSLIAKIICHGRTRTEAIAGMRAALGATVVEGVTSNLDLLRAVVISEGFQSGRTFTSFLDANREALGI